MAIPASVESILANTSINLNTSDVYVVEEATKLEDTIGAAAAANNGTVTTVIIALGPGVYPQTTSYTITVNVIIVADPSLKTFRRRRLQTTPVDPVIYAIADSRHYTVAGALIATDGVIFQGSLTSYYSGGVQLTDGAEGIFLNTTFRYCRTVANGGGLQLLNGSTTTIGTGSEFLGNEAAVAGGAIFAETGCSININNTVRFINNTALRTSASGTGGGAIYLDGATLTLGSNVSFVSDQSDDITTVAASVTCADPSSVTSLLNCNPCTGSYDIPTDCQICSPWSTSSCSTCPKGSYGGSEAEISCQLCAYGYTTWYPPSSMNSTDCMPITDPPTIAPTGAPTTVPTGKEEGGQNKAGSIRIYVRKRRRRKTKEEERAQPHEIGRQAGILSVKRC